MTRIYNKAYKILPVILLILFSSILYLIFLFGSQDNDMYFEIVSGNDLLSGNFKTASHLDNFPMLVQQWLYAVCLAMVDKFGILGRITFVYVQDVILWVLASLFIYKKTKSKSTAMIGSFAAILYSHNYMINIRPQIITVILLVAELLILEKYRENREHKYLFAIFPILILAANFHQAVFLYHIMIMVPYCFDKRIKHIIDWKLVAFVPFFTACTLLTPYGIDGSLYILRTFQSKTYDIIGIAELQGISLLSYMGFKLLLLVVYTIYCIYKHKANTFMCYYIFLVAILSLINMRHTSIEFIPVMFIIAYTDWGWIKNQYMYGVLSLLCIGLSAMFIKNPDFKLENYGDITTVIEDKDAKIINSAMDIGGWFEYNGYTKLWMDSRCEAFSEEISGVKGIPADYFRLVYGYNIGPKKNYSFASEEEILDTVRDYDYIVSKKLDYINRVADTEWDLIYDDGSYLVWKKAQ